MQKKTKMHLRRSGVAITLQQPTKEAIDCAIVGMGKVTNARAINVDDVTRSMFLAYDALRLSVDVLNDPIVKEWAETVGNGRFDHLLLTIYKSLLENNIVTIDVDYVDNLIAGQNLFFHSAIRQRIMDSVKHNEIKFINALNMAKYHLRSHFEHKLADKIIDAFLLEWVSFSLGKREVMWDWDEIVGFIKVVDAKKDGTITEDDILPVWLWKVLAKHMVKQIDFTLTKDNNGECLCHDIMEMLIEDPSMISQLGAEALEQMARKLERPEQPTPRERTMRGDGRRELTTINGYTFPKRNGRW